MLARPIVAAALVEFLAIAVPAAHAATWSPPVGIPAPSFGIVEAAPARPSSWTVPVAGYYYVDATQPGATDSLNPYGTPAKPRLTIPTALPAGSVVELHGTYDQPHSSPKTIVAAGTSASPVYIRGVSATSRPLIRRNWEVTGTYLILENLEFGPANQVDTGSLVIRAPSSHIALRASDLHGNVIDGGLGIQSWGDGTIVTDNVVIYGNSVHDNGDVNAAFDQDVHGISVGDHVSRVWVVDNEMYRNSGDGIQINATVGLDATTHHIYVGRNVAHHNKQTGFWVKQATDVIFSQNTSYAHRPSNSSMGQCMGGQYGPDYVWFIDNHVSDCEYGIAQMSDDANGLVDLHTFVVGNVIHNIHRTTISNTPDDPWGPSAILVVGGLNRWVINNTIYDVDSGVNSPSPYGTLQIADTIIGNVVQAAGSHVNLGFASLAANTSLHHNVLFGNPRANFGNGQTPLTASTLTAQLSTSGDPQFVDAIAADFHLRSTSPAVDAGELNAVYARFQQRYGVTILASPDGAVRPSGAAMDIGAFESAGCPESVPGAPQNFTLSTTSTSATFTWSPPVGCAPVAGYVLAVGLTPGATAVSGPVGLVTSLTVSLLTATPGTYYVRVQAQNSAGMSVPSNEVTLRIGSAPGAPTNLTASLVAGTVTLRWSPPTSGGAVASYVVEVGSTPGATDLSTGSVPSTTTMTTAPAPPRGTYYIRVRAKNDVGVSAPSNEVVLVVR